MSSKKIATAADKARRHYRLDPASVKKAVVLAVVGQVRQLLGDRAAVDTADRTYYLSNDIGGRLSCACGDQTSPRDKTGSRLCTHILAYRLAVIGGTVQPLPNARPTVSEDMTIEPAGFDTGRR